MKYPQIGHIVHKRNVTKCDKCWRMMWNEVLNYKCDHCHRIICVECEQSESSDRCIGCSRIICSGCDNRRHDCVRCQGYVCPICVDTHDKESSNITSVKMHVAFILDREDIISILVISLILMRKNLTLAMIHRRQKSTAFT